MGATVAAALKKLAVAVLTDKKLRKVVFGIVLGILIIILMPIAAVLALLMLIRHYPGLKNIPTGTEPQIDLLKRLRRGK